MHEFWRRWLIAAAIISGLAGTGFAALAILDASAVSIALFDFVYLPGTTPNDPGQVAAFSMGVMGAVMAGWSATMLTLLWSKEASINPSTWRAITFGLLVWLIVDSVVSVAAGAYFNLILNTGFLILFVPPLIATRPD